MKLQELQNYVAAQGQDMTKIEVTLEVDSELTDSDYYVTKTKETYVYGDESEADVKIDEVRQLQGFEAATKKFKAGKVSKKSGEMLSPDTYTVVIKLNH